MGNSEVGHMNIGAGRIVYQDLLRINRAIEAGSFAEEPVMQAAFEQAKQTGARLHFMGLVSQGGVHSQQAHLEALCRAASDAGIRDFAVHAFTDGRDTSPRTAVKYLGELENVLSETGGRIASVHGRYYAMDRDNRWERIAQTYATLVRGEGAQYGTAIEGVEAHYAQNITDEFIRPFVVGEAINVAPNDVVICFNFRTDRVPRNHLRLDAAGLPRSRNDPAAFALRHDDQLR